MPILSKNIQKIKRTKLLHRYNLPFDGNSCEKSGFARRSGNNPFQTDTVYLLIADFVESTAKFSPCFSTLCTKTGQRRRFDTAL